MWPSLIVVLMSYLLCCTCTGICVQNILSGYRCLIFTFKKLNTLFSLVNYSCLKDQSFDSSSPLETELSSSDTNIHSGTVNSQNWSKKHIIYEVGTDCTCMQWCAQVVNWTHLYNMYSGELHPRRGYLCLEVVDTTTPVWAHHCTHIHLTIYRPQSGNDADVVWVGVVWVGVVCSPGWSQSRTLCTSSRDIPPPKLGHL